MVGSFIPITLEQLARERGVLLSDRSKSCTANPKHHGSTAMDRALNVLPRIERLEIGPCVIQILGTEINTASFAMYTFSISVFIQTLVIISMSGAADHGVYRKLLLLCFAFFGAAATMLFIVVIPRVYLLGGLFAIIANVSFGASFVLLNSFLPLLVRHHPSVQRIASHTSRRSDHTEPHNFAGARNQRYGSTGAEEQDLEESSEALLGQSELDQLSHQSNSRVSPELTLSTRISSYGIGIGYLAAVIVQLIAVAIILITKSVSESTTLALRIVLFFVGFWWLVFTVPAAFWLRPRPGPPIPFTSEGKQRRNWAGYISYAWASMFKTILRARRLKDVVLFLALWFLLSDGIATISGTATLYGKTQLGMTSPQLAMINVVVTLFGILGAFMWSKLSRSLDLPPARTIVVCICVFETIPIYSLLGYIPAIQRLGVFGLQQPWELFLLGAVYGIVLGGLSSYCRSLFGELIPVRVIICLGSGTFLLCILT